MTLPLLAPPVWYEDTSRSLNVYFKNSCCSLPALRQVRMADLMCSPVAQASNNFGVALFTFITKWKSCICTLPAPPPPPTDIVPLCDSPQDQDSTSISFLCLESALSPCIPSSFKK